jgi:hypothetical protein
MLYLEMLVYVIRLGHPVVVVEYKHVAMRLRWGHTVKIHTCVWVCSPTAAKLRISTSCCC